MRRLVALIISLLIGTACLADSTASGTFGFGSAAGGGGLTCTTADDSDIYSHTGHSGESTYFGVARYKGLIFTLAAETRITSVDLWIANASGASRDTILRIETTSAGLPTNTLADVAASKTVSVGVGAGQVITFDFDTPFTLAAGTYSATVRGPEADVGPTLGLDAEAGHFCYTSDSGANWADDTGSNGYLVVRGCQ